MTMHNSIPQFGRPAHRRVLAEIALDGINGGIFYGLRSREVWLASAEVHNIYSWLSQRRGFGDKSRWGGKVGSGGSRWKCGLGGGWFDWKHGCFRFVGFVWVCKFTPGCR